MTKDIDMGDASGPRATRSAPEAPDGSSPKVTPAIAWPPGTQPAMHCLLNGDVQFIDKVEDAPLLTIKGHNGVDPLSLFAPSADAVMDMLRGIQQMIDNEECGGDGWWAGWGKVKSAFHFLLPDDAQGGEALGRDAQRLDAEHEHPVTEGHAPASSDGAALDRARTP